MSLRLPMFALACTAALTASASPMLDANNVRAKAGIAYVDRKGTMPINEDFSKDLSQWTVGNHENLLSITAGNYEGENSAIIALKRDKCDNAWELKSKKLDVTPGSDFTFKFSTRGTVDLSKPSAHGNSWVTGIFWYDAEEKLLDDIINFGIPSKPDKWTENIVEGTVPPNAARALVSFGADGPNLKPNDVIALSKISFFVRQPQMECQPQGTFTSAPFLVEGTEQKLSWDIKSAFGKMNFTAKDIAFQIATAPDANGIPGKWSQFAGPDGTEKSFFTSSGTTIKTPQPWVRYKATMYSNGTKTPLLKSVTIGKTTHDKWTVGDTSAPRLIMVSESPNQHPEKPIVFKIEDDSPLDMTRFHCFFDGEEITKKLVRKGDNTFSYHEDKPFQPDTISMCPLRWTNSNHLGLCAFEPLEDRTGAVRVQLVSKPGDTSFKFISMPLPVIPGKEYSFGIRVRHPMNLKGLQKNQGDIRWIDNDSKPVGTTIPILLGDACKEWTLYTFKGTAPEGAYAAVVSVGFDAPNITNEKNFDLDQLVFEGPQPPPAKPDLSVPHVHTIKVKGYDLCGNEFTEEQVILFGEMVTKNVVTMRDDGFILIDGKPFFPRGLYGMREKPFNNNSYDQAFKDIRKNGFNFAHTYKDCNSPKRHVFLDSAAANGIKVWIPPASPIVDGVLRERNHPAILAWYLGDDTASHIPAEVVRQNHNLCHAIDNAHLTTQADVVGGRYSSRYFAYVHSTDTFQPEIYPMLVEKPLAKEVPTVINDMETIKADIKRSGSPVKSIWAIIQHFDGWGWKRFPTFEEQRAMTYLAIIHGAHGLTWYTYGGNDKEYRGVTSSPERWDEICRIGRELESLDYALTARNAAKQPKATVISGPEQDACNHPSISCLLKNNDGKKILFTANSSTEPVKAYINLKGFKKAKVLFEDREISIDEKGQLNDEFVKFGVHIYELQ